MLEKAYEAKKYEDRLYRKWEESGAFVADAKSAKKPFTISLPPPNATGVLHAGHAVMLALEDIMIRHKRMKGYEALWVPGTDHAAIATESVVIRQIRDKEGIPNPRSLGRPELLRRIAAYVAQSQDTIRNQVRKMGASCDWSRERYTMDPALNRCVNEVFVKMYQDGLIYRGQRVVNWDTALQTTLADDEVEHEEREGVLYTFEYLTAEQTGGEPVLVSTSRPETKLGDTALAVHPDDARYAPLIGKHFKVQWPNGPQITVSVIADHHVEAEFGSGVVGVTPYHSKIDYELWQRHKSEIQAQPIQVIDEQGRIMAGIEGYAGLRTKEAREKFVEELRKAGRLKEERKYAQQMSISYRSKKEVEPLPKLQWFVDVNKAVVDWMGKKMSLKQVMQQMVESRQIRILPERFEETYFHWVNNLQDWCVSRQIWWGHRIPVWYKGEEIHVGMSSPEGDGWQQDEDTLDTWFSSGLWTWSTLVDPELAQDPSLSLEQLLEKSADFRKFHPTQVLETGYDILFFWVARMILMTTYATKQIPFETVYLHGLVRTREGKKMSKSDPKTCIDPLTVIDQYGADALRLSLVMGNAPGSDMGLYDEKIKGCRNFTNKVWNASRFVLGLLEEQRLTAAPALDEAMFSEADRWTLGKLNRLIEKTDQALDEYQMGAASEGLYGFFWNDFCDWYLELSKGEKQNLAVLCHVLRQSLILMHPFIPFVTEAIWEQLPGVEGMLIHQPYPEPGKEAGKSQSLDRLIEIVGTLRRLRSESKIAPADKIPATLYAHAHLAEIQSLAPEIERLARLSELTLKGEGPALDNAATEVLSGLEIFIPLEGLVDGEKEKGRMAKEIAVLEGQIQGLEAKLENEQFVKNAPVAVVQIERERLAEAQDRLGKLRGQM